MFVDLFGYSGAVCVLVHNTWNALCFVFCYTISGIENFYFLVLYFPVYTEVGVTFLAAAIQKVERLFDRCCIWIAGDNRVVHVAWTDGETTVLPRLPSVALVLFTA